MSKTNENNSELESIDVSAINWFKTKNSYSEKFLKKICDKELKDNPEKNKELSELFENKKKELIAANKIIYNFKQLRSTCKLIQLALESFDDNCGNKEQIKNLKSEENSIINFLKVKDFIKREKIAEKYENGQDKDLPDFDAKRQKLISNSEKIFKRYGFKFFEYMPKSLPWYRSIMSSSGSGPAIGNIRKSKSKNKKDESEQDNKMSKWMEKLSDDQKLINLMIPSSHDAGSYSMQPNSEADIAGRLAQTQKLNIMGQLKSGIRGFDWRIKKQGKILVFYHGIITGTNVMEGVKHVCKFLDSNPSEVVFIRMRSSGNDCKDIFFKNNYVKKNLEPRLFAPEKNMVATIKEISLKDLRNNKLKQEAKGCVVLLADKAKDIYEKDGRYYCLPNTLFNQKYNKKTRTSGDNDTMINAEIDSIKEILKKGGFTGINTLNTAHWTSIISQLSGLKSEGTSVYPTEDAKKNLTKNIKKLITELKKNGDGKLPNSFGIDNAGSKKVAKAIELIINQNSEPKKSEDEEKK